MGVADRYLADDEELVHLTRQHWTTLLGAFGVGAVVVAVAAGLLWAIPTGEAWGRWAAYVVVGLAVLTAVVHWFVPLLRWWTTVYILTGRRLMERYGLLAKHGRDIPLTRVNDVTFSISLWERVMGCGTLAIQSASEQEGMALPRVPRVEWLQGEIYRQVDDAQRHDAAPDAWGTPPPWGGR